MKKSLRLTIFFQFIFCSEFYAQQHSGIVTGKVIEETTKLPAEFVNVALVNSNDSTISDGAITNRKGNFIIDSIAEGNYFLRISFIGYHRKETKPFRVTARNKTDAGTIALNVSEIILKDVEITGEKDVFVNTIDRKVYYPEKDIQAQTGSAAEVMENIPSVSVDEDGNVSLRGSENVTFLINGKPSGLMKAAPEIALQQIPATMIERIEIITNPSAKYKPDGAGGIINIVLKKGFKPGLNGTLIGNVSNNNRYNGNLSLNYNPGKLNLYGTYGFKQNYFYRKVNDSRINRDTTESAPAFFEQNNSADSCSISTRKLRSAPSSA